MHGPDAEPSHNLYLKLCTSVLKSFPANFGKAADQQVSHVFSFHLIFRAQIRQSLLAAFKLQFQLALHIGIYILAKARTRRIFFGTTERHQILHGKIDKHSPVSIVWVFGHSEPHSEAEKRTSYTHMGPSRHTVHQKGAETFLATVFRQIHRPGCESRSLRAAIPSDPSIT